MTSMNEHLEALVSGIPYAIANLANAAAVIWQSVKEINWVGFYLLREDRLVLGPFQGKPACIEIPLGRGVCGTAAAENRTQSVPDVHLFPGHIACDSASASEIVIPLRRDGRVFGVLDIDSPVKGRFTEQDRLELEETAEIISRACGDACACM